MTRAQADTFATRRDLWLCLARALAPPGDESYHKAFVEDLPADLAAIAEEIRLDIASELDRLAEAAKMLHDALEIQILYAALFATPPAPVFINTAIYLDGGFLGESELAIHDWYARHGFERRNDFHDLNDHAAVQLEFVGQLYEKAAGRAMAGEDMDALAFASEAARFLAAYPRRWITPLLQRLEETCSERSLNDAFVHIARILLRAIMAEQESAAARFEVEARSILPQGSSRGIGDLTSEDLAEVAVRMKSAGLDFAHVRARPEWHEEAFVARLEKSDTEGNGTAC